MSITKKSEIIKALKEHTSPLGPFLSLEEFEEYKREWCDSLDVDDIDILLDLLVEGPSPTRFHMQDVEEVGTIIVEALVEITKRYMLDLGPKILTRIEEFSRFLHVIELIGMLGNPILLPVLIYLYREKRLSQSDKISLIWSVSQVGGPEADDFLASMKRDLSLDKELQETIDTVLTQVN